MKTSMNTIFLIIILFFSAQTHAAIDAIQTIDISDDDNYLQNALKAGDTLTIRVKGLASANATNTSFTYVSGGTTRTLKITLDDRFFVEAPGEGYKSCPVSSVHPIGTCVERKFIVIRSDGTYSTLNILDTSTGHSTYQLVMVEKTSGWSLRASGGFLVSGLTQPKYFISTDGNTQHVARNREAEDDISLGLAGYMHTCNEAWRLAEWRMLIPRCITFGLGLSDQSNDLNFFPGISWRLGEELYVTFGAQFAKIDTLPNGLRIGSEIDFPNAISTLDSKYTAGPFLSISYQFLGGGTRSSFADRFSPEE